LDGPGDGAVSAPHPFLVRRVIGRGECQRCCAWAG
jgi:hypothetical protein